MALRDTLKARWFWYSNLCVLCWGGWALLSRLGSREIPPQTMQFLFTIGTLPVGLALLGLIPIGLITRSGRVCTRAQPYLMAYFAPPQWITFAPPLTQ
jgi:hypothetical protein